MRSGHTAIHSHGAISHRNLSSITRGAAVQGADAGRAGAACCVSAVCHQHDGIRAYDRIGARDAGADRGGVERGAGERGRDTCRGDGVAVDGARILHRSGVSFERSVRGGRRAGFLAAAAAGGRRASLCLLWRSAGECLRQMRRAGGGGRLLPGVRCAVRAAARRGARGQRSVGNGTPPADRGMAGAAVIPEGD